MSDSRKADDERLREVTISLPEDLLAWLESQPGTLSEKVRRLIEYVMVEQASGTRRVVYRYGNSAQLPDGREPWSSCDTFGS